MSTQLIPVFDGAISGHYTQLCNARALHSHMEVKRDFTDWIKSRIAKFGFVAGTDFITVENLSTPEKGSAKARAQKLTDYHITLDMAKELSMVENNTKGREARQYFIARERQAIALMQAYIPGDLYKRALNAEKREAASFALASSAGKSLSYRRKEKKVLQELIALMREEVQLRLLLGHVSEQLESGV